MALFDNLNIPGPLQSAAISITSATTTALVAAVAGKQIFVVRLLLVSDDGVGTAVFGDGVTTFTGAIKLGVGIPMLLNPNGAPWFSCAAGNAFNLVSAGATVLLRGKFDYIQI